MSKNRTYYQGYEKEKYFLAFILGFGCLIISLLPMMIVNHGYFVYSGDYNAQQIPFYNMANDTVRSGSFGWNWLTDLGSDFMTSYSFYLFGSPFFWLSTLLPRGLVTYAMPFLLALKHGLASLTAYAYIRRFVKNKYAAVIGGLLYACSGFQAYNVFFNHFQHVTALFPLMLIAMEEAINNKRKGVFAIMVAVMAINNYYFFAGQAVFLVLYYLFRWKSPDFHTSWKKFFGLCFEAIVGTMIAAFVLLPSALAIISNKRVDEMMYGLDMVIYTDSTIIPRVIQTFFMPPDPPAAPNLFFSDYEKWASIGGYFPLFSMAGVIAFMHSKRKHWATKLSFALIFFAFIPVLNSLFQAMNFYYYARWFYMPILIFAMMTAVSLDDENADVDFGWKFCVGAIAVFAVIGCLPSQLFNSKPFFFLLPDDIAYFWIVIGVAVACLIVSKIIFIKKKNHKPFIKASVYITAFAAIGCFFTTFLYTAANIDSERYYVDNVIDGKKYVYEEADENNFFRIDTYGGYENIGMIWGLPNMRCFQSTVNTSIMDFYNAIDIDRNVGSRAEPSHFTLRGLFSVKYFYRPIENNKTYQVLLSDDREREVQKLAMALNSGEKKDFSNAIIPEEIPGFEYIETRGDYEIYENKLFIPMGIAYDTYISEDNADDKKAKQRERVLLDALVLSDDQIKKYSDIMTEYTSKKSLDKDDYTKFCKQKRAKASSYFKYDSHGFESGITLDKPQLVFYSVPYSDGWTAEVNGKKVDVEKVSYGFMAVKAEAGENNIVFHYETPGLRYGIIISVSGIALLLGYLIIGFIIKKKSKNNEVGHTHYYDYESIQKIDASQEYIRSLIGKDKK